MKVGIIGLGLIGGSIALKLKDLFDNLTIYGYDIDHDSISYSIKSKIIDAKYDEDLLNELDYIFLAIPVESIKNQLQNYLDKISEKTMIIDLGSTKFQICNSVKDHKKERTIWPPILLQVQNFQDLVQPQRTYLIIKL